MATLAQERHIELVSGASERFVITSSMTAASIPTQLPHLNVFVVVVIDKSDAKDDKFSRVARISDLSILPIGRDNALATTGEYLAASVTLGYPTLNEALLAQTAIKDRVNKLVTDWMTFAADFNAPDPTPVEYTLPSVDASQKTALINAYKNAKQDRYTKQLAKTEADAVLTRAQNDYTYKLGLVTSLDNLVSKASANQTAFTNAKASYDSLTDAGDDFYGAASCADSGNRTVFQAALNIAANESTILQGNVTDAGVLASSVTGFRTSRTTERDAAATAQATATSQQATKATALTSAQALEASALAAVLAVCPDFDSTSIPLVDG